MIETAGNKLRKEREKKKWTIDDVARATRMHPDRVRDLEQDEYGNFPNLSYGRNFLVLYARHLGLEASDVGDAVNENHFGLDDYEYMHTGREQPMPAVVTEKPSRSIGPILLGTLVLGLLLTLVVSYFVISAKRLGSGREPVASAPVEKVIPVAAPTAPVPAAAPTIALRSEVEPRPAPTVTAEEVPSPTLEEDNTTVMRAVPVNSAETLPEAKQVVVMSATVKTKVLVRQGPEGDSTVVFDDFLYPDASPVTLRGDRLVIESKGGNINLEQNGETVPFTAPSVTIE